ncbi:MAG TPA: hypothetical protein VMY38_01870 [Gemmatimonadaceae bacterium]|nr:hypothetical protein [Gemmatimonadaceae bacterium]
MTAPFVVELRSRPGVSVLPQRGGDTEAAMLHLRVEMPEVWDVARIDASPEEPVLAVKVHALAALYPKANSHDDFVIKLRGLEIFDESQSLADAGARDGSIFLVTHRRRRPVRS